MLLGQLVPTALAVAEKYNRSGIDFLNATLVGFEVAFRAGACWHKYHQTWRAGGSWGSLPNAASATKLMNLDEEQIWNALGIAEYHAPLIPINRDLEHPAMVKHGMGWGAMNGIMSAELAELGYTGIPSILGFEQFSHMVADIGKNYLIDPVLGFKEIPGCAYGHLPIYCIRKIKNEVNFQPDDIADILVETFDAAFSLPKGLPTNTENAQFSVVWPITCELLYEEYGPLQQLEGAFNDPQAHDLLDKITIEVNEEFNRLCEQRDSGGPDGAFINRVTIKLKSGEEYSAIDSKKSFGHQLSENQLIEKFRWLTSLVMPEEKIKKVIEATLDLENVDEIEKFIRVVG